MERALYLDTSAVLRATLERGLTPEVERRVAEAEVLVTSRLSLVEAARVLHRLRQTPETAERKLAQVDREIDELFSRCEVWELTSEVCELACRVAPSKNLRTLDALHLATYLIARRRIDGLEILTSDKRLADAAAP